MKTLDPTYRRLRETGMAPPLAVQVLRTKREIDALDWKHEGDGPNGEGVFTLTKDGLAYEVTIGVDEHAGRPEDNGDCYDADDIDAFDRGLWNYYYVTVTAPNGGEDSMGGIDAGDYFKRYSLLDAAEQVLACLLGYSMLETATEHGYKEAQERDLAALRATITLAEDKGDGTCLHCGGEVAVVPTGHGPKPAHRTTGFLFCLNDDNRVLKAEP